MSTPERKGSFSREQKGGGMPLGGETHRRTVADRRHKKGECPTCGNKTHKIGLFGKRTALTVEGSCLYGRCLLCNPVEGYQRRVPAEAPPAPTVMEGVPQVRTLADLVIDASKPDDIPDDATMVSGITMDHRLIVGARNWNGDVELDELYDSDSFERGGWTSSGRPEPSVEGIDDMRPPERQRPTSDVSFGGGASRPMAPPKRYSGGSNMNNEISNKGHISGNLAQVPEDDRSRGSRQQQPRYITPVDAIRTQARVGSNSGSGGRNVGASMGSAESSSTPRNNNNNNISRFHSPPSAEELGAVEDIYNQARIYDVEVSQFPSDVMRHEEKSEIQDRAANTWNSTPNEFALNVENAVEASSPMVGGFHKSNINLIEDTTVDDLSEPPMNDEMDYRRDLTAIDQSRQFRRDITAIDHSQQFRRDHEEELSPNHSPRPTATRMKSQAGSVWSRDNAEEEILASPPASAHPPLVDRSKRGMPDDDFTEGLGGGRNRVSNPQANVRKTGECNSQKDDGPPATLDDIPDVIASLDQDNHVRGFQQLAELIMAHGQVAKLKIKEYSGIDVLVQRMWKDMPDPSVMEAACELLFALSASADGNPESDILVGESAEGAVDALLITMQTHIQQQSIQQSGCGALHCLASASCTNPQVPDGTLSGAVYTVANAMEMLPHAQEVQEWGIRALYSQCLLSAHAEANKTNLVQSGNHLDVIRKAMETAKKDLVTVELSCRLYWSLAANEDVARVLMESPGPVQAIMNAVETYHKRPDAAPTTQAAFGAMTNLARVCEDQQFFRDAGAISQVIASLQTFHYQVELYVEACSLLSVFGTDPRNAKMLTSGDAVGSINKIVKNYSDNIPLQEEGLWALVCIASNSEEAKISLTNETFISTLLRQMRGSNFSKEYQNMTSMLVASLCVLKQGSQIFVTSGGFDVLIGLLKDHPNDRKIQEIVFVIFRNISSHGVGVDMFLNYHTAKVVLDAMTTTSESANAQLNACCMLWNICAKAKKDPSALVDGGAIAQVVRSMQSHMESGELLEMACGALWCLIDQSDTRKKELLGCGAIDAVTCALVMHPKEPLTLEKACGLLANVCTSSHMAEAIADSQGISMVVEALGSNSNSMKLLELGTLVLRNMVLTSSRNATEAANGISTIINCMRNNPDEVGFQREACNALWAMAAQSEDCKNKILALDGVTVLMEALEHNSCVKDVQDAARGAINQLALNNN